MRRGIGIQRGYRKEQKVNERKLDQREAERCKFLCQNNIWPTLSSWALSRHLEMGDTHWHLSVCMSVPRVRVCMCGHWSLEITAGGEAKLTTAVLLTYKPHDIDLFLIPA